MEQMPICGPQSTWMLGPAFAVVRSSASKVLFSFFLHGKNQVTLRPLFRLVHLVKENYEHFLVMPTLLMLVVIRCGELGLTAVSCCIEIIRKLFTYMAKSVLLMLKR